MPLYEYECTACHKRTEKIQKFSDPEITACPKCGGALERVISAPAISFKGGGWYADGYGSAKPAATPGAAAEGGGSDTGSKDGGAKETGGGKESAGSDSKPSSGDSSTPSAIPTAPAAAPATPAATKS